MSKGNLFLGMARGSVGDVVFTHVAGKQVARARNRSPKNPQTVLQLVQRICLNTASKAFSAMQAICNHSFEGFAEGTECQSVFMRRNVQLLRDKIADVIADPTEEQVLASQAYNYSFKGDLLAALNEYEVSHGTLPPLSLKAGTTLETFGGYLKFVVDPETTASTLTYQQVITGLGITPGDQLTFLALGHDYTQQNATSQITAVEVARVIMAPASGELSTPFLSSGAVNSPNEKNTGGVYFAATFESGECTLRIRQVNNLIASGGSTAFSMVGLAVIVSEQLGDKWLRSTQSIVKLPIESETQLLLNNMLIGDAYLTYKAGISASPLYLNQAENF